MATVKLNMGRYRRAVFALFALVSFSPAADAGFTSVFDGLAVEVDSIEGGFNGVLSDLPFLNAFGTPLAGSTANWFYSIPESPPIFTVVGANEQLVTMEVRNGSTILGTGSYVGTYDLKIHVTTMFDAYYIDGVGVVPGKPEDGRAPDYPAGQGYILAKVARSFTSRGLME